ncbi:zinc finger C2H2 domain-containing protein [Candidatus Nitrososphaera gargensis Ga9.2]|uniref:Zinc finger C2H2 domain-containing protein n=1 Tax=Nitrososphaera gargensis (strain Ga9.2) TaxID=1237085 RepID=K0IJA5_NITGG|nr:hypothetical protein [Candidatus Nitrososphaera gargensis]AFU58332.1 zinc finger C2H2 domain-containing protein [Candidatus Nitrososphaera gargensis Ga9.2]
MSGDPERLKWYICRICGAKFAFVYDKEQHAVQTGHEEFSEKEMNNSDRA